MKRILLIGTMCLTGCGLDMLSVHPLFEGDDLVFDESLLGQWNAGKGEVWSFTKTGSKGYKLKVSEKGKETNEKDALLVHLVQLSGLLFLDVSNPDAGVTGIPGHFFFQIRLQPGVLEIAFIDDDWLKTKVAGEKKLSHLLVQKKSTVVTASTRELQYFLMRYGRDPEAFPKWRRLTPVEQ